MSDLERIHEALHRTARRRRWLRGWKGFACGLLTGALVWMLSLAVFKLLPIPPVTLMLGLGAVGVCAAFGLARARLRTVRG
jgi:hypothetical protein